MTMTEIPADAVMPEGTDFGSAMPGATPTTMLFLFRMVEAYVRPGHEPARVRVHPDDDRALHVLCRCRLTGTFDDWLAHAS